MHRARIAAAAVAACAAVGGGGFAVAQLSKETGRIGPDKRLQPSGRKLNPAGRPTQPLGNFPAGGELTTIVRFLWTLSSGRGNNDIRIVHVEPKARCRKGRRGRACRKRRLAKVGKVVQTI